MRGRKRREKREEVRVGGCSELKVEEGCTSPTEAGGGCGDHKRNELQGSKSTTNKAQTCRLGKYTYRLNINKPILHRYRVPC